MLGVIGIQNINLLIKLNYSKSALTIPWRLGLVNQYPRVSSGAVLEDDTLKPR
jgi:hypothetical protein